MKYEIDKSKFQELYEKAWLLQKEDYDKIKKGKANELFEQEEFVNPFIPTTQFDRENPHIHLLKIIRNPLNFTFTCKEVLNVELLPFQNVILRELWNRTLPMLVATRGGGKSFILAVYIMLRALIMQGRRIVIVGAAFRQAKYIFEYCEFIWRNAPVYRDLVGVSQSKNVRDNGPRRDIDRCEMVIGKSIVVALPLGSGNTIRGQRANDIIADEFASINVEIIEEVVKGFGSVSQHVVENVKREAQVAFLKEMGMWEEQEKCEEIKDNQFIISGTADYDFNSYAKYWKRYKAMLESRGNKEKLMDLLGYVPDQFLDWRDYCVIRIPHDMYPPGFMDEKTIANNRATSTSLGIFQKEYGAVFVADSDGFFKRSLIDSCIADGIRLPIEFHVDFTDNRDYEHVYAIDPASESDNFSVVIIQLHSNHRRVVYCWTTSKKKHKVLMKINPDIPKDFYSYCMRKLRYLMKSFPCSAIAVDKQGGGVAVIEAFHDKDKLKSGEQLIWEVIEEGKEKDTDFEQGLHLLHIIQFSNAQWVSEANHGLKKDMEDKAILFPYFDPVSISLANLEDREAGRIIVDDEQNEFQVDDTLEDCVMEIEEMKDEMTTIVYSKTAHEGREHWDVPTLKGASKKIGRLKKDRYSALLMANAVARKMQRTAPPSTFASEGYSSEELRRKEGIEGPLYKGPKWWTDQVGGTGGYGGCVVRRGVF